MHPSGHPGKWGLFPFPSQGLGGGEAVPNTENDYLRIESPSSLKDLFTLMAFSGHEEMSRLFSFTLELDSANQAIDPKDVIGQKITFCAAYIENKAKKWRYFNGYINRLSAGTSESGHRHYQAEVVPWLWFLTRTSDCRIFADKKVPDILDEVFKDCPFQHKVDPKLKKGDYTPWHYCVQYRETDFNFVSRLMEQEGIYYYFKHSKDDHTLVLGDKAEHYDDSKREIQYQYSYAGGGVKEDVITHWVHQYQYVPGAYAQTDYNFKEQPPRSNQHPDQPLLSTKPAKGRAKQFLHADKHEIFDFPGEYGKKSEGDDWTQRYMEEEEVACDVANGSGVCEFFSPGVKFQLKFDASVSKTESEKSKGENRAYTLLSVQHSATNQTAGGGSETYSNSFTCIPANVNFRPARITRKPSIQGMQTAVVVGPPGSEIHTDKFGRVQVQFFWDRHGTRSQGKEEKPVWIRVGQIVAGKNWGAMFIPRVGQEVMVSFLEGDPDWPLVTGSVYNADQTMPYTLPDEKTKSYIKTNSSPGGDGFNELRFEDKKGSEQIFIHAEHNMDQRVKNESKERIFGNRHQIIGWTKDGNKAGDQREMVYGNKQQKIHKNQVEHIGGNMELLVGGVDDGQGNQDIVLKGTKKELIEKDCNLHVKGKRSEKVDTDQSLTVGNNQQEKVGMKHALEAGQEIHLKSGMKIVIEAGMQLTLKGPGGFVDIGPAGVTIQGTLVNINSGGAAGAGSGSNPTAPEDAKEAQPTEPALADDHKTGQKSTPY
jgi:type VI secretion system secreted protein VgrG